MHEYKLRGQFMNDRCEIRTWFPVGRMPALASWNGGCGRSRRLLDGVFSHRSGNAVVPAALPVPCVYRVALSWLRGDQGVAPAGPWRLYRGAQAECAGGFRIAAWLRDCGLPQEPRSAVLVAAGFLCRHCTVRRCAQHPAVSVYIIVSLRNRIGGRGHVQDHWSRWKRVWTCQCSAAQAVDCRGSREFPD